MRYDPITETEAFGTYELPWPLTQVRRIQMNTRLPRAVRWLAGKPLGLHRELTKGCYDIEYRGLRLRLFIKENLSDNLIFRHGRHHEEEEFTFFERVRGERLVFVDIGANIGLYALLAHQALGPGSRIIAFEPHPRTRSKLVFNLAANRAAEAVEVMEAGLAERKGVLRLYSAASAGAASMLKGGEANEFIEVPVEVLPDRLEGAGVWRPDIIKIDIEGFEDRALLPLFQIWPPERWPRFILIETEQRTRWRRDCVAELTERGYSTVYEAERNLHLARS